jgi:hypothetical protein
VLEVLVFGKLADEPVEQGGVFRDGGADAEAGDSGASGGSG